MSWFFNYEVDYYDEFENGQKKDYGIVTGRDHAEAIKKLGDYYGMEAMEKVSLSYFNTDIDDIITAEHFPMTVSAARMENKE